MSPLFHTVFHNMYINVHWTYVLYTISSRGADENQDFWSTQSSKGFFKEVWVFEAHKTAFLPKNHDFFPQPLVKKPKLFFGQNDKLPMYDSRPKVRVNSLYFLGGNFEGKKNIFRATNSHVFVASIPGPLFSQKNLQNNLRGSDLDLGFFFGTGFPHQKPPISEASHSQSSKIGMKWFPKMVGFPNNHGKILLKMIILGESPHQPKNRKLLFFLLGHFRTLRHLRWEKLQMFKFGLRNSWSNELEDWQSNSFSSSIRTAKKQQRWHSFTDLKRRKVCFQFHFDLRNLWFFARQFFKKLLPSKWHQFWTCHRNLFRHSWTKMVKSFCKSRFFSKFHPSPRNSFEICQDSICFSRADGSIGKRPQKSAF